MSNHHGSRKFWTRQRLLRLGGLLEDGKTDAQIAKIFETTAVAIRVARKRNRVPSRTSMLLTASGVARMLGIPCPKTIALWIENGWLEGSLSNIRCGRNRRWIVNESAVFAFLENPDHWHRWQPERIPDRSLREWVLELRAGVRFLSLTEAAWIACVQPRTVHEWIRKGWLPAVRNGNHKVGDSDLRELLKTRTPWGLVELSERAGGEGNV